MKKLCYNTCHFDKAFVKSRMKRNLTLTFLRVIYCIPGKVGQLPGVMQTSFWCKDSVLDSFIPWKDVGQQNIIIVSSVSEC